MEKVEVYCNHKNTPSAQRVLILLEELNLKYNIKDLEQDNNVFKNELYVKYYDRLLIEPRSILRYIAKNNLEIDDFLGGSEADMWLEVESKRYEPLVKSIINLKMSKDEIDEESIKELESLLDTYEVRLSNNLYIGGDKFSIADISHIPHTYQMLQCGFKTLYKERPHVYKWLKRIIKRDSVDWVCKVASKSEEE